MIFIDVNTDAALTTGGVLLGDMAAIQNKLLNLLRCPIGSRFRQPEFGTLLNQFVHELTDRITTEAILNDLLTAIGRWMKDEIVVTMGSSYVVPMPSGAGYYVKISYSVPKLRQTGALSFSALRD